MSINPTRERAWALLTEYTQSESLIKHALAVEAAVRGYARRAGADEEFWGVTALLHDFDYERWPNLSEHPFRGAEILQQSLELALELMGQDALTWFNPPGVVPPIEEWVGSAFNYLRATTIYGGSNEVMKDLVGRAVVG